MICTNKGYEILEELKETFQEASGLSLKEKKLAQILDIKKVIIVPGDVNIESSTTQLLGKEASEYLTAVAKKTAQSQLQVAALSLH